MTLRYNAWVVGVQTSLREELAPEGGPQWHSRNEYTSFIQQRYVVVESVVFLSRTRYGQILFQRFASTRSADSSCIQTCDAPSLRAPAVQFRDVHPERNSLEIHSNLLVGSWTDLRLPVLSKKDEVRYECIVGVGRLSYLTA